MSKRHLTAAVRPMARFPCDMPSGAATSLLSPGPGTCSSRPRLPGRLGPGPAAPQPVHAHCGPVWGPWSPPWAPAPVWRVVQIHSSSVRRHMAQRELERDQTLLMWRWDVAASKGVNLSVTVEEGHGK